LIHDLFTWLLATFVMGPAQAEFAEMMQAARAPDAIMQQVQACAAGGTPILVERAMNDPWWAITTTISVTAGLTDPQSILAEASPECAAAILAVKPFLGDPEA
jgi:hypothetical protein